MSDEDDVACITICQGPPQCLLEGDEAETAQKAGCVWCKRIYIHSDGTETITEPSRA